MVPWWLGAARPRNSPPSHDCRDCCPDLPQLSLLTLSISIPSQSYHTIDRLINMADETANPSVDETPLSPIERQESLEKHLQMRPDAQDLKNRNILQNTNAAP